MTPVLAAPPWHYWLGVFLFVVTMLFALGTAIGYYRRVVVPTMALKRWEEEQRRQAALSAARALAQVAVRQDELQGERTAQPEQPALGQPETGLEDMVAEQRQAEAERVGRSTA